MFVSSFFLPGGEDLQRYYLPFADGCLECGFVPFYAQMLLKPSTWIPQQFLWPIWSFVSLGGWLYLCHRTKINPVFFVLSFPLLGQFWLGQIDILVAAGLILAYTSHKPLARGAGLALMLIKPQLTGLAVLYLLLKEEKRQVPRVILIPVVGFGLSLLLYGANWPLEWFANARNSIPDHAWKLAANILWPWGLVLLPLPFLFKNKKKGLLVALLSASLAIPFFSVYSYVIFLLFFAPWWSMPLSYLWLAGYPWMGVEAMRFAWILPAVLLAFELIKRVTSVDEIQEMPPQTP